MPEHLSAILEQNGGPASPFGNNFPTPLKNRAEAGMMEALARGLVILSIVASVVSKAARRSPVSLSAIRQ